jgi:hypothetical protein
MGIFRQSCALRRQSAKLCAPDDGLSYCFSSFGSELLHEYLWTIYTNLADTKIERGGPNNCFVDVVLFLHICMFCQLSTLWQERMCHMPEYLLDNRLGGNDRYLETGCF